MKRLLCILTLCLSLFGTMMAQQGTFAPQGAEWYFQNEYVNVPITQPSFGYLRYAVTGEAEILGHVCSVINNQDYVYEENNVVYWYNQVNDAFTVLYDFNAEVGDTWYCDVAECTCLVTVTSVDSVTWNGHTYRTQYVEAWSELYSSFFNGRIFEGIGYEKGLFPDETACYECFDCDEISYLRCYLENGEMLYHEGSYDCDYIPGITGNCWDGTVASSYAGGNGTAENPFMISNSYQLALLAQQTNDGTGGDVYYKLTSDINLQKCSGGSISWTSIGTPEHPFTGHFDGNGMYVLNLYQGQNSDFKGLFGCTNGAEIKNVVIRECMIFNQAEYAGGLVGYAGNTNISGCSIEVSTVNCEEGYAGGLVGFAGLPYGEYGSSEQSYTITDCSVEGGVEVNSSGWCAGGIVGQINDMNANATYVVSNCARRGTGEYSHVMGNLSAGGIVGNVGGCDGDGGRVYILNSYNRGEVLSVMGAGGIVGGNENNRHCIVQNVYNTGQINAEEAIMGSIAFAHTVTDLFGDCYWLDRGNHAGVSYGEPLQKSCAFHPTTSPTEWQLDSVRYGTTDLLEALNHGAEALVAQYPMLTEIHVWQAGNTGFDHGYPVLGEAIVYPSLVGSEWYYEILNDDGSITYQYLYQSNDTVIDDETVHIIVKINTLYDKELYDEMTHEYIFERDGKVYWWNKTLQEFTVLYDFNAQVGDEWEIKVGTSQLLIHVDEEGTTEYNGQTYRTLNVSDAENLFTGVIICGIGHETSFFPEQLMSKNADYHVEGIRCVWQYGQLIFQLTDVACDEVYLDYHYDIEESVEDGFQVYPNPTNGMITVSGCQTGDYYINNLMGQTLMTGQINVENQQIDISELPTGLYFITVANQTLKLIKQ